MEHLEHLRHIRFGAKTKYKRSLYDRIEERRAEEAARKQEHLNEHAIDPYLIWISLFVCLSVAVGAHVVIPGEGLGHYSQVGLLAVLAFFVSFVGNKWLFHEGAELVANGSRMALIACVFYLLGMVAFVGSLGFVGTAYESTESLSRRAPLVAIQHAEQTATQTSVGASSLLPVANSIASWAVSTAQGEERSGIVSGRPGAGPMTAQLRAMATAIRRTVSSLGSGERKRLAIANQLQNIASEYERELGAGGSSNASRARLVKIYSKAQRLLTELENAVPLQAMHGLVRQLRSMPAPAAKPGRMDVRAALNGHVSDVSPPGTF